MAQAGAWNRYAAGQPRSTVLHVEIDRAAMARIERELQGIPGGIRRVMPPAMNKAAAATKTMLYRAFSERMNISRKGSIKERLQLVPKASRDNMAAGIRIDLARFTVASFKRTRQMKAGVRWSPGGGRMLMIPRAFLRKGLTHYQTGKHMDLRQVWRRAGDGDDLVPRYPLKILRGPSLAAVFERDESFQSDAERRAGDILEKKSIQQIDRVVKR